MERPPRPSPAPDSAPPAPAPPQNRTVELGPRGSLPEFQRTGEELHPRVYTSVVLAFAWIVGIAWLDFGFERSTEAAWLATVPVVIAIVFFNIPFILRHANGARPRGHKQDMEDFLWSNLETATGRLRGWEAYVQIMTIPLSLALAATLLGLIWTWVGGSA